ncbi:MAG: thiolase C-terminal domain-containing protein, partial [Actinomycetota bacterium]
QVPMLVESLDLQPGLVNPSGGPLAADPITATGLIRIAEATRQATGTAGTHQVPGARRTLAHAASGHAMQQNMVWLLEGDAA